MRPHLLVLAAAACSGSTRPSATVPPPSPPAAGPTHAPTAPAAPPAAPIPHAQRVRSVEGITEYRLANGLQVLLFPDATQSTVTVNVTYLVGSRHEGYGQTGMAHLLEHMMFKGTPTHRNVLKLLEERGGQGNGTTSLDRTNYYETMPASQQNLEWALDLEADRMRNASISTDDLSSEFSVVRNEFEMNENEPSTILDERIMSTAYLWHNYGKPTIGSRADIEHVPVKSLKAFYDLYYQPDNAVLVVAGKLDEATALATIEGRFGKVARPSRVLEPTYTVEPVQDGDREVTLRRNGDVTMLGVAYHVVAGASDDYPAVEAALDVLAREPSGRLYKLLVETSLASTISSSLEQTRDPYVAELSVEIRDGKNLPKIREIMTREIEGLGASAIDSKALERWRTSTLKDLELAFTDSQQLAIDLSEFAALGDWRTLFTYRNRVESVTAADVVRVAKAYFKASNRTIGTFVPTKQFDRAPLTESPDVAAQVKGVESGDVKNPGEPFEATLDNIEKHTTRVALAGGINAALLPKKTRGGKVTLELRLHWGDEKSLQNTTIPAVLLGALMTRGTAKKSYQDLQDEEDRLRARISIDTTSSGLTLHVETLRDHLPGAIDLAFEMLEKASLPAKQLEVVRQEQLAHLEEELDDPQSIAWRLLNQLMSPWPKGDPRRQMSADEEIDAIKKISRADIQRFYKELVGAGHGELAIVGDFDAKAISDQIGKQLTGWPSKKPYTRLAEKRFGEAAQTKSIDVPDKEMTAVVMSHDIAMKDTDADYPAWMILSQILGGTAGSRIWMRLREREGLSYSAGSWAYADPFDSAGGIGVSAIVAPQNLAKAKASLLEEVQAMQSGKVDEQELQRAKDTWVKELDTNLSSDSYVVEILANQTYRGRTTQYTKDLLAKILALTPADIARVAKAYLDPKRLIVIDAG